MPQERADLIPPDVLRQLSGLDVLQGIIDGLYPPPPIAQVLHFALTEVAHGRAVFTGEVARMHYSPLGTVHGGYVATLLDSAMACAVQTTLPAGTAYTSVEIKVNFVRPLTVDNGRVRAEGSVISAGRRIATAEGRLLDAQGKLLAHGTTTCLLFPIP